MRKAGSLFAPGLRIVWHQPQKLKFTPTLML